PSAPGVVEVKVIVPLLPITLAVTVPLPTSPEAAVAATAVPLPRLAAGTRNEIWSIAGLVVPSAPVPTCRNRIRGTVTWKSRWAVALPVPLTNCDSALAAIGMAARAAVASRVLVNKRMVMSSGGRIGGLGTVASGTRSDGGKPWLAPVPPGSVSMKNRVGGAGCMKRANLVGQVSPGWATA